MIFALLREKIRKSVAVVGFTGKMKNLIDCDEDLELVLRYEDQVEKYFE
jgi:hypothetical protein